MQTKPALPILITICFLLSACGSAATPPTPTATPLPPATATATPLPTFTPTPIPMVSLIEDADCLTGPGPDYASVATLEAGQQVEVIARNSDNTFWIVKTQDEIECWVESRFTTAITFGVGALPEKAPPPVPTPAPPSAPSELAASVVCNPVYGHPRNTYSERGPRVGTSVAITLTWKDNAKGEIGYQVYRNGNVVGIPPADATSFTDTISFDNTTVNLGLIYAIKAFNNKGSSEKIELTVSVICT